MDVQEEKELAGHLIEASNIGYSKTRREVFGIVERYVEQKDNVSLQSPTVTHGWWQKFLKRNPTLSLRAGDSTASIRMDAMNADNLKNQLRKIFDNYDFDNHPEAIYNMDESGVPLEPRPPKVIAQKGKRRFVTKLALVKNNKSPLLAVAVPQDNVSLISLFLQQNRLITCGLGMKLVDPITLRVKVAG